MPSRHFIEVADSEVDDRQEFCHAPRFSPERDHHHGIDRQCPGRCEGRRRQLMGAIEPGVREVEVDVDQRLVDQIAIAGHRTEPARLDRNNEHSPNRARSPG